MVGVGKRQAFLLGVCAALWLAGCGEGRTIGSNRGDAGGNDEGDETEQVTEQERGLCSPTIGGCTLESSSGCPSVQPGNDLACEDEGASCHYCPVYNESVSVSRCTGERWVNTRATCAE